MIKAALVALLVFCFLMFGLEPLAWFFYHASHALNFDGLYWGYRGFRMAGFFLASWPYQIIACVVAALLAGGLYWLNDRRKEKKRAVVGETNYE